MLQKDLDTAILIHFEKPMTNRRNRQTLCDVIRHSVHSALNTFKEYQISNIKMHLKSLSVVIASLMLMATKSVMSIKDVGRADCVEDYTPCTCDSTAAGRNIVCDQVSIQQIKSLFSRIPTTDLASFKLTTSTSEDSGIPGNFLGDTRVNSISINCSTTSYELTIDDNAFTASENATKSIMISGCYFVQQRNFTFLSGFSEITSLNIFNSRNFTSFEGLPSQPNLYYISIVNCRGFDSFVNQGSVALTGLRILYLYDNDLNDRSTANILSSLAAASIESLEELRLYNNKLSKVPALIPSFSKLNQLMMENNNIDLITTRSLAFYNDVIYLHLGNNAIQSIEPSAFGAHKFGTVYLHQNKLTRFESYVFQVMLEGMVQSGYGSVSLYENPIECDCHLAWLVYHKRELLPIVDGGQCSNSTMFTDLDADAFVDCPIFTCPQNVDGNFPNPLSCSSYYICSNGSSVVVECPGGLVFNPAYQLCDWSYNVPTCNA